MLKLNLIGHKYGKLTVVEEHKSEKPGVRWRCTCECGGESISLSGNLRRGISTSCGCVNSENVIQRNIGRTKHGVTRHPAMKQMFGTMHKRLTVDNEWGRTISGGESFVSWVLSNGWGPGNKYKLELIDSTKPVGPHNCRLVLYTPGMIGKVFNDLTVVAQTTSCGGRVWDCLCSCGNTTTALTRQLQVGHKKSCGCKSSEATIRRNKENATHGLRNHAIYVVWGAMLNRCADKTNKYYGAKGITVCDEWKYNVASFFEWAVRNGWRRGLAIHRKDPKGNYTPDNCTFMTKSAHTTLHNHWRYGD